MQFEPQGYTPDGVALFGSDERLLVRFFHHPQIGKFESDAAGRPIYHDVLMIEVIQPGEKESVKVLANDWHKMRFPKQWDAFQKGIQAERHGTRLDHLFPSEPAQIKSLEAMNVYTVEELASISDTSIGNIPMGRQLVDRARAYLASASSGVAHHQSQREIEDLKAQVAALTEKLAMSPEPQRRGPGRPPNPKPIEGAVA